eukprot:GHVL01032879.1.p2 GENE.GHVL01032879.1~~GHVL01032879.1.p2  ORF type:complete len:115 (-),score=40.56 GHVL01032879.1:41-385(-)
MNTGTGSRDLPEHADVTTVKTQDGDWILLASDGVWDNMFSRSIISFLRGTPEEAAKFIAQKSRENATNELIKTPWSETQKALGMMSTQGGAFQGGGKLDDVAVVVAVVSNIGGV